MSDDDLMLAADWSELPVDLLGLITDKLKKKNTFLLMDYIRFGAVCFEWRKSFFCILNYKQIKLPSNLPLLLLPSQFDEEDYNHDHDDDDDEEDEQDDYHNQFDEEDYNHDHDDEDKEQEKNQDDNHEDDDEDKEQEKNQDDNHEDDDDDEDKEQEKNQDDNHEDDDDEEEDVHDDYHNHDHAFDHHDEEEEDEHEHLFIYHEPEPRQYYYKPEDIWKGQDQTRYKSTRSFYSLSEGKVNQDFQLPVPYYKNCRGSSHGWLITVDEEVQPDGTYIYPVRLLNPFRSVNNQIQLPPLTPIRELDEEPTSSYYLIKAYLSANPSSLSNPSEDLLVLGMYGCNRFVFCRPDDIAWTYTPFERKFRPIQDLICYKSRFLAIIQGGSVLELDFAHHLHPKPPSVKFFAGPPANGSIFNQKYLVESGGDLLQVQRHNISNNYSTTGFRAFKLNDDAASSNDNDKWVEMDNLDGRMLFLGNNSSISLSAADFPGLMPNCIYFTDDNYEAYEANYEAYEAYEDDWDGPHDIGIFNFEDKSVVFDHGLIMPQPIWIQPML